LLLLLEKLNLNTPTSGKNLNTNYTSNNNGVRDSVSNNSNISISDFTALMPYPLDDIKTLGQKNAKLRKLLVQASEKISELVINHLTCLIFLNFFNFFKLRTQSIMN